MISNEKTRRKRIALFFALLLFVQNFYPVAVFALTSGPSQPEMQKFQPAGANDMVDLFSGDFKYDIPLMDVGGYPLNLSYHSGTGIEDEASWVGAGWSMNPGSITRDMRGLPDDFTGEGTDSDPADVIKTVQHQKDYKKIGGQLSFKPTGLGFPIGSASLHVDVHKDNYWGIGASIGGGVNFTLGQTASTSLTAGLQLNSDNRNGVTVSPNLTLTAGVDDLKEGNNGTLSGGFTYNTRSGLESVSLSQSFNPFSQTFDESGRQTGGLKGDIGFASFDKYFIHTYTPTHSFNTTHSQSTFSLDLGPAFFAGYFGIGGSGYVSTQKNVELTSDVPAYGYMHYPEIANNPSVSPSILLDFNREKDGVFIAGQPAIPIPVATHDYFVATSQAGMQQFRPVYNGNYIVYDRQFSDKSTTSAFGLTLGAGNAFQVGAQLNLTSAQSVTKKWTTNNNYITSAEHNPPSNRDYEGVYFKQAGEQTAMDQNFYGLIGRDVAQKVGLLTTAANGPMATNILWSASGANQTVQPMFRQYRDVRTATFSYLTAQQASVYGLDKKVVNGNGTEDRIDDPTVSDPNLNCRRKPHHISEITVTDKEGKRMVYGTPVYNLYKEEASFSVATSNNPTIDRRTGLISYVSDATDAVHGDNTAGNSQGRYNNFNQKVTPPYSTGFLLTGILSPDYVDKTHDGITDDDLGSAIKFCYVKGGIYNWRAPFTADAAKANYNEGFLSDKQDDKASYVFGKKEIWYLDSIRTRTLVAVFYRSPRQDGLGVVDHNGTLNPDMRLQKLDKIALFSRADIKRNGTNAVPIKVVHFEYDYSLFPGVPNNAGDDPTAGTGKLTLRKVYFTFGNSSRGQTNPYVFTYDNSTIGSAGPWGASIYTGESNDNYAPRQTDRWGTYRQSYFTTTTHILTNSEFPYSLQPADNDPYDVRQLADRFASKWQLTSIVTPTGATISIDYESDDYSYVQDRKAMIMCPVVGFDRNGTSSGMTVANKIFVKIPTTAGVNSIQDFIDTYLSGPNGQPWNNIAYKINTDLDNKGDNEYVYGYSQIDDDATHSKYDFQVGSDVVGIPLVKVNQSNPVFAYNPISVAAWQLIQTDLPQYAYPNYDNTNVDNLSGDVKAAVKSIIQSFSNLRELTESFDQMAVAKGYGNKIDPSRSLVRLNFPVGKGVGSGTTKTYGKLGGGARVKKVSISDNWKTMSQAADAKTTLYGVTYDYRINDDQGNPISSGVASYEPEIGNEENPFHEPVNYTEKVQWSNDRYHYIEKPFGESYFPAPSVGYSQVKVTAFGVDSDNPGNPVSKTGYIINQFYTGRDFPTQVDYLPLEKDTYEYDLTLLLFGAKYTNRVATSQGFRITLNDMHGKPKSVQTYDNNDKLITGTDYFYNVEDANAQQKKLNNTVLAMDRDGSIPGAGMLIATDADIVTDVRESKTTSSGTTVDANYGGFFAFWLFGFSGFYYAQTGSLTSYNSVSSVKVIHQYGLLQQVRTTQNGSTFTADNLLWDSQTGDILLTRNQNEFNDYTYALHYPALRAFDGMGSAYRNQGIVLSGFATESDGTLSDDPYKSYLSPGDELVDIDEGMEIRGWILQSQDGSLRLIDQNGNFIQANGNYMVIRSGRRNMLTASGGVVVTVNNPMMLGGDGYFLQAGLSQKVLDSKAVTYKDEWGVPVPDFMTMATVRTDTVMPEPDQPLSHDGFASFNYELSSNGNMDCFPNVFRAAATLPQNQPLGFPVETRGFLGFGSAPSELRTPGISILSVQLSLTGVTTTGINTAYIKRIISDPLPACGPLVSWSDQDVTTEDYKALLPKSTNSAQNYSVDLTAMYRNWLASTGGIGDFSIAMVLASVRTGVSGEMSFQGAKATVPPALTITYSTPGVCTDPVNNILNPYYTGVKGNWRPNYSYAYQVTRDQTPGNAGQDGGTNIRSNGWYNSYVPFWVPFVAGSGAYTTLNSISGVTGSPGNVTDPRWIWASRSVNYDQKGNEVENVDPLGRFNSALFGYQQSLATATAGNARHVEIGYDGFEDYNYSLQPDQDPCPLSFRPWEFGYQVGAGDCANCIVNTVAHTGNYSLKLTSGSMQVFRLGGSSTIPEHILGFDAPGHAILLSNDQAGGFTGISGKDYVLSFWVNDGAPNAKQVSGLTLTVAGSNPQSINNLTANAIVEGWKQVTYRIKAGATTVQLSATSSINLDDIRVFPFDAEMKSFVYDDQSLRLMAQLDENNFAILYEYDREGTPIRVKKETEQGIMTLKENRQSLITH